MKRGVEGRGATPRGAWTTTTPVDEGSRGKAETKKDVMAIVAAHRPAYAATVNVAFPEDFLKKVLKAREIRGPRFFHAFSPCPPGWRYPPEKTIAIGRLATDTNVFPLYEIEAGRTGVTRKLGKAKPVREYLEAQGRFGHLTTEEIAAIQADVDAHWRRTARCRGVEPVRPLQREPPRTGYESRGIQ